MKTKKKDTFYLCHQFEERTCCWNKSNWENNDWIPFGWTLSPVSEYTYSTFVTSRGNVYYSGTSYYQSVAPAVYLGSGVTITGGDGSPDNPYTLG